MRQFEPAVVSLSMEAQIDAGDTIEKVSAKVKKLVRAEVEEEVLRLKRERQESIDEEMEKAA